ncbi:MAG: TetR/AcrR family transcriptional regulator [Myxococcota bacterium]
MTKRRDAGRARGQPIENAILLTALEDLATHGLEGLNIPRIAAKAQVNKTSIYRRWATREDLARAALEAALAAQSTELRDTGSLRGDLELLVGMLAKRLSTPSGRALARVALSEASSEQFVTLSGAILERELEEGAALVRRAVQRGEWDLAKHAPDALFAMVSGGVMHRLMLERRPITPEWTSTIVDVLVRGLQVHRVVPSRE